PVALTIAGSDPSGGAGIQADLKTFHQFGVYGEAAITLLTVQNTLGVARVECVPAALVIEQIRAVIGDIPPQAAKTGALGSAEIVEALAELAAQFQFPLVVDPVMVGSDGAPLVSADARRAIANRLLPRAFLVMPNLDEAAALTGIEVKTVGAMREAAARLCAMGARAALVKGGHLEGAATDVLYSDGVWREFAAPRIETRHTHGTGCTYSAAVTASLARGNPLEDAVARAKEYITNALRTAPGLGRGRGPLNHHA
ncbi:MAG TPA: bifunctional hydroxymethylpyrimidine kinase/phosphomethylpyrimidine kinase, partial [Bryobacteraceae bacterium]|nr:bifunctional hydroxymethylpyrimidine kinase/phosphomethylpyrimidine kinase [Bryobacteraceae bacterium]